jgi:16S rRNA G966 N2-methylase RsmD
MASELRTSETEKVSYGPISVNFLTALDGGGRNFESDFALVVKNLFGRVDSLCEFGAGPGFIGFSALAKGLCRRLCLIDINPLAIELCRKTVIENGLVDTVKVYHSDGLSNVPKSEKWDLVVSNPPWHKSHLMHGSLNNWGVDDNWNVRRKFYATIHEYLKPGSSIVFLESRRTSSPFLWHKMLANSPNLEFVKCFRVRSFTFAFPRLEDLKFAGRASISELRRLRLGQLGEYAREVPLLFLPFSRFQSGYFVWSRLKQQGPKVGAPR